MTLGPSGSNKAVGAERGAEFRVELLGGLGGNEGLGDLALELGRALGGPLKFGFPKMRGEGGRGRIGGIDEGDLANAFRLDGPIQVELELHEGVRTDAAGLAVVVAVDGPRLFFEWILTGFFFPDGAVGVFAPLISVAIRLPKNGVSGDRPVVKTCSGEPRVAGFAWIILGQELAQGKGRKEQTDGHGPDHDSMEGAESSGVNPGAT